MAKTHTVEIPEWILLTLAAYGNMGEGEIPKLVQLWAESECKNRGLHEQLKAERNERYAELKKRVSNVWGSDVVSKIEGLASIAGAAIGEAGKKEGYIK
jgi:hypothetical protein